MSFEIVLRREAQVDLDGIFIWYEQQKVGLELDFINEFESTINRITRNPLLCFIHRTGCKKCLLKKVSLWDNI